MLRTLLRLVAARQAMPSWELARELDLSPDLVETMLETLEQQGCLCGAEDGCTPPCSGCSLRPACPAPGRPRTWILTAKGRRLLGLS